jgi:hypothetical protein
MDAASTINITANGTAVLRVTWSNGRGSGVFTNDCPFTVLAESATDPHAVLSIAASTTLSAAAAALLPTGLLLHALLLRPLC